MTAAILPLNAGSSSTRFAAFAVKAGAVAAEALAEGEADRIGDAPHLRIVPHLWIVEATKDERKTR